MPVAVDLRGKRFGRLKVLRLSPRGRVGYLAASVRMWLCRCQCGREISIRSGSLLSSNTRSCGCMKLERIAKMGRQKLKHGHAKGELTTRTYKIWVGMHRRCNPKAGAIHRKYYADQGIKVCARWSGEHGYRNFLKDMGEAPEGKSIDRFPDPWGNYEKDNCRWATKKEQARNKTRDRWDSAEWAQSGHTERPPDLYYQVKGKS